MRQTGLLMLFYTFWIIFVTFVWWFGLALGIGDSGFKFHSDMEFIVNGTTALSTIAAVAGIIALFVGCISLLMQKVAGSNVSLLGIKSVIMSALFLDVQTFLYNIEAGRGEIVDLLYACFVIVSLTLLYILPAATLFKKLQNLPQTSSIK